MAVLQDYDQETRISRWIIVDPWTVEELVEAVLRDLGDPLCFPDSGLLVDWSDARAPSDEEVAAWLERTVPYQMLQARRRALVLPESMLSAAMTAPQATGSVNGVSVGVFPSNDSAEAWLGVKTREIPIRVS